MLQAITEIILIIVLLIILVEDLLYRQVHIWLFILGLLVCGVIFWKSGSEVSGVFVNMGFILLQLGGVILYSIYKNKLPLRFSGVLGAGDIMMWGILIFGFSPINFIVFFIISLLLSVILHYLFSRRQSKIIPLCGWQGFCFSLVLGLREMDWVGDLYSDIHWFVWLGGTH